MRNKKPAQSAIGVDAATGTLGQGGVFQCFLEQAVCRAREGMDEGIDGRSVSGVLQPHARLQLVGPVGPALGQIDPTLLATMTMQSEPQGQ